MNNTPIKRDLLDCSAKHQSRFIALSLSLGCIESAACISYIHIPFAERVLAKSIARSKLNFRPDVARKNEKALEKEGKTKCRCHLALAGP